MNNVISNNIWQLFYYNIYRKDVYFYNWNIDINIYNLYFIIIVVYRIVQDSLLLWCTLLL